MSRLGGCSLFSSRSLLHFRSPLARLFGDKIPPVGGNIVLTWNSYQGKVNPAASSSFLPSQRLLNRTRSSKQQTNTTGASPAFPMQVALKPKRCWKCVPSQILQKLTQLWNQESSSRSARDGFKPQGCSGLPETAWQRFLHRLELLWHHSPSESSLSTTACPACSGPTAARPPWAVCPNAQSKGIYLQPTWCHLHGGPTTLGAHMVGTAINSCGNVPGRELIYLESEAC